MTIVAVGLDGELGTWKIGAQPPSVVRGVAFPSTLKEKALAGASPATTVAPGATGPEALVELNTGVKVVEPGALSA